LKEITKSDWNVFFPYDEVRPAQEKAINEILNHYASGKRFVVAECGTGVGKSAIALTVHRYVNEYGKNEEVEKGSWILTTQKVLQEQYINDFKDTELRNISSSSNYACTCSKTATTCAEGIAESKAKGDNSGWNPMGEVLCPYKISKKNFVESYAGLTNFPYFLSLFNYAGGNKRNFMVIDESHNTELELSKFIEVIVTQRFAKSTLKLNVPHINTQRQAFNWIHDHYYPAASRRLKFITRTLQSAGIKSKIEQFKKLTRQIDLLKSHVAKIENFLEVYNRDEWVYCVTYNSNNEKRFEFKPINVAQYTGDYIFKFADKVLLMSATILNHSAFCQILGIPKDNNAFVNIPSPFPIENKPIIIAPIGSMSYKNIDNTLPLMKSAIEEILKEHANEKGVIHSHSYKIAKFLKENVDSDRILTHNSENRAEILEQHINGDKPTVLLSPSMTEGVDLANDASRFQILCKIPYPYLGDKLVKQRMQRWKWWYPLQTAKTIIQAVGRSIRNKDDHAVTYILDADWDRFYSRNKNIFPEDFRKCLKG
jgi:ATP-dependent DNA helicase DinG